MNFFVLYARIESIYFFNSIIFFFNRCFLPYRTSYTSAVYGSNQNVFIRLDSMGRTPSVGSGSYATIASIHKFPIESRRESRSQSRRSPSPYATTHIALADNSGHVYVKPDSYPSRVSYYASSQLMHIAQVIFSPSFKKKNHLSNSESRQRTVYIRKFVV